MKRYSEREIQEAVKLVEDLGLAEYLYKDPRGQGTSRHKTESHSTNFSRYSSRSTRNLALLVVPAALLAIPAVVFGAFVAVMSAFQTTDLSSHSSRNTSRRRSFRRSSHRSSRDYWSRNSKSTSHQGSRFIR